MRFGAVNSSRRPTWVVLVTTWLVLGGAWGGLGERLLPPMGQEAPIRSLPRASDENAAAGALATLGGLRTVLADLAWLQAAGAWESQDPIGTIAALRLATLLDPASLYFWINGARILAYDLPAWGHARDEPSGLRPESVRRRWNQEAGRRAIDWLAQAERQHPGRAAVWVERAQIELHVLEDRRAAAASFRRAWESDEHPWFAARLHAGLLRSLGEREAALAFLVQLYPQLPADDPAAEKELVAERIRRLRAELSPD